MAAFEVDGRTLRLLGATRPVPGDRDLLAAGLHSRRLVLLKTLLTRAGRAGLSEHARQALRRDWRLLEKAEAHSPAAVRDVLSYPAVGNWLAHALSTTDPDAFAAAVADLGTVAAVAALDGGLSFHAELPVRGGRLVLPGVGAFETAARRLRLEAAPRTLTLVPEGAGGGTVLSRAHLPVESPGWRTVRALPGGSGVLDDLDPYLAVTGDVAGLRPYGVRSERRVRPWTELWSAALGVLRSADPERAAEVTALVRAVVPVRWKPCSRASATRGCAPWAVLATLPGSPEEMAEVLVHEVQHSKLAVLDDLVRLHHGPADAVYEVGWRADRRPLGAVIQGTYAHLALADLWHRLATEPGTGDTARRAARVRREDYRAQVADALSLLLESGQLTAKGREFVEGMRGHHAELGAASSPAAGNPLSNGHYG